MTKTTNLSPRGRQHVGTIVKAKAQKTATLEFVWKRYVPKYERYLVRRTRLVVHNPQEINAKPGDIVEAYECRPISKTKNFIITKIIGKDVHFLETAEFREESKVGVKKEPAEQKKKEISP